MPLADDVLPLIRTRADLHRWSAANDHGRGMHEAVDKLEAAVPTGDPAEVYSVTHRALASAIKVISRADDSSGIIGDACRRLFALHPKAAAAARVPGRKLCDWMITFQFDGEVDYFELDPVAYAPALGDRGLEAYRAVVVEKRRQLGPDPADRWQGTHAHERFVLSRIEQRLAVLDRDIDAIIATHSRDRKVAAWLTDTAKALAEIGEFELAIDWAEQATDFDGGHQSRQAAEYWCVLLADHRPADLVDARLAVFRRWPTEATAGRLRAAAGSRWPDLEPEVSATLADNPREAVGFALRQLDDVSLAWHLAVTLDLDSGDLWSELAKQYEKVDPLATLPVHRRLVEGTLARADAKLYRAAARRLVTMRRLAAGSIEQEQVDKFIAELRQEHRRRPRLQQEFDRAGLP